MPGHYRVNNICWRKDNLYIVLKKDPDSSLCTKIKSKIVEDLPIKAETLNLLEKTDETVKDKIVGKDS